MKLANWGNYPVIDAEVTSFSAIDELRDILQQRGECIARGLGRCYGDSSLGNRVISTLRYNRVLSFDSRSGVIRCQAGVSLADIVRVFVPRGWFLPVTPGTKYVTVGGAVASDIHGKNHHMAGCFSRHVLSIKIMEADGSVIECGPDRNADLFRATCGGMGLTGVILEVEFHLLPVETAYIRQETVKAKNLFEIMDVFEQSASWTYSVAWIDCLAKGASLGRSVMMRGEHATREQLAGSKHYDEPLKTGGESKLNVPLFFPGFALNGLSVKLFNMLYYAKAPKGTHSGVVHLEPFFYPLDVVNNWNRIYGKRGFTQYQFVLLKESSREGLPKIIQAIAESGQGSFLAVLKLFGKESGLISFPKEGYTLALDFAITPGLFEFFARLDAMVLDYGGRLYLTKDVRMNADTFHKGYRGAEEFSRIRKESDPDGKFSSLQSKRIGI